MGNSRTVNQKANGNRRQQNVNSTSMRSTVPQKNIETMRVLSNVRIPNVVRPANQWNTDNFRNSGYFTEAFVNNDQQVNTCPRLDEEAVPTDIVTEALSAAINEGDEQNQNALDVMDELANISVSAGLLQVISSWNNDDDFANTAKQTSSSNNQKKEKSSTKKSRRPSHKEEPTKKKQKLHGDERNKEGLSELKQLLTSTCKMENRKEKVTEVKNSSTHDPTNKQQSNVIVIPHVDLDDSEGINEVFSQDTDMLVFKEAINLKKKLISEKEATDRDYAQYQEEVNSLKSEIERLKEQLTSAEERLAETSRCREKLTKKVKWVLSSL